MTIALATIGCIVIILCAAARIPPAAAAFVRACIPLITAIHDLGEAMRRHRDHVDTARGDGADAEDGKEADATRHGDGVDAEPDEYNMV